MPDNTSSIIPIGGGSSGGGSATNITVGTTTVTGGGTNRVLYEDAAQLVAASTSLAFDGTTLTVGVPAAANSVAINETAGQITFEGATADAFETRLGVTDPTVGDQTFLLPNRGAAVTDTIATLGAGNAFTSNMSVAGTTTLGFTQIPTNLIVFGPNDGTSTFIGKVTALTPDAYVMFTGSLSNSIHMQETADSAFDFNNGLSTTNASTDPALIIHSHNQNTTEYNQLNFMGSHGGNVTTLTDNVATTFAHSPTITAGQIYAGTGTYAVKVVDAGSEVQVATGTFEWYAMRGTTGGTVGGIQNVGNDGVLPGLPLKAVSSGTLAITLSAAVASNVVSFQMTADTSLTPTTFTMTSQLDVRTAPAEMIAD